MYHAIRSSIGKPNVVDVHYRPWDHDWWEFAKFIQYNNTLARHGDPLVVVLIGFSWGAGWGAMRLARELQALGIEVRDMVLSDPVYRSAWWLLAWRSKFPSGHGQGKERTKIGLLFRAACCLLWRLGQALPWLVPEIAVPDKVERMWVARQSQNLPQGHDLSSRCWPHETYDYSVRHAAMDDLKEFHSVAKRRAAE